MKRMMVIMNTVVGQLDGDTVFEEKEKEMKLKSDSGCQLGSQLTLYRF